MRSLIGDAVLAILVTLVGIAGTVASNHWSVTALRPVDAIGLLLVAANGLVLVLRRRQPVATVLAGSVLTSTYLILGYAYGPILLALLIAVYSVARHRPLATSVPTAFAALVVLLVHIFRTAAPGLVGVVPGSAWVVVPFALGTVVRLQREASSRARSEQLRQRVDDERLRIAQEVHDVVGHGLAAIKMQAEVALHVLPKKPEQAEVALAAISRTSGDALDELRATLAVVRRGESQAPGLARLDDLQQRMNEAGVEVQVTTTGDPRELPSVVDLTGYRILQESLTNVLRHSSDKRASVTIAYATDAVVITVTNPLAGPVGDSGGLGIPGMRQRVASLGGEFTAGPAGDGRFEVHARLPIEGNH